MSSNRLRLDQIPARYHAQVVTQLATRKDTPTPAPAAKKRIRQNSAGLNKTEQAFYEYLSARHEKPHSQAITFKIANGCRYTPDFAVFGGDGEIVCYEVKGFMRDDAAVKLKVAASLYPHVAFHIVTSKPKKAGGGWDIQCVLP